jgi:hypothetical protein
VYAVALLLLTYLAALTKAAQPIKDTMPGIANALDYLYAQVILSAAPGPA